MRHRRLFSAAFYSSLGMVVANFGYQFLTSHDWWAACERSFFQVGAVFIFAISLVIIEDGL